MIRYRRLTAPLVFAIAVAALLAIPSPSAACGEQLECPWLWEWNRLFCGCQCLSYDCCVYYGGTPGGCGGSSGSSVSLAQALAAPQTDRATAASSPVCQAETEVGVTATR